MMGGFIIPYNSVTFIPLIRLMILIINTYYKIFIIFINLPLELELF